MQRKTSIDALGAFLLVTIMATLGLNQVAIKFVNEAIDPILQAGLRSACAIPLLSAYMLFRGKRFDTSKAILIPGVLAGLCFAAEFAMLFTAINYTSVGRTTIFFYTMPFWVALAAHFLIPNERMTTIKFIGLIMAVLGVALALSSNEAPASPNALLGDFLALGGAVLWACIALLAKTTKLSEASPELQLFYQITVSAFLLIPFALFVGESINDATLFHWSLFSLQVVFVVCISFVVWFWVLSVYPASDMASFGFLAPLFGLIFSWLLLDEAVTINLIAALILVAAGIILVNKKPRLKSS